MSGLRLNFLVQVTLCWESGMCFSNSSHECPPQGAHGPFRDSLQESCHHEERVTPTPLPSWIHMRLLCLSLLKEHCLYSSDTQQSEEFCLYGAPAPRKSYWLGKGLHPLFDKLNQEVMMQFLKMNTFFLILSLSKFFASDMGQNQLPSSCAKEHKRCNEAFIFRFSQTNWGSSRIKFVLCVLL